MIRSSQPDALINRGDSPTEIDSPNVEKLYDAVCDRVRVTMRQSNEVVLQQSQQRLANNHGDVQALHVVAASSLARRQPAKSLELLGRNPISFREDPITNRIAGYAWLIKKDAGKARECFDHAVRLDPNLPDCWNWLGRFAEQNEEFDQAAEYYERGMLFDDGTHDSAIALSQLHVRKRKLADGIHTLRVSLIRDRRSPLLNLALAKLLERRAFTLGRRRRFLVQQRVLHEALDCYRVANAVAPTSHSLVMQGRLEQQLHDYGKARETFRRAVELDPRSPGALAHLAGANVDFGDLPQAIEQFERSLELDPARAETHFRYTRAMKFKPSGKTKAYLSGLLNQIAATDETTDRQKMIFFQFAAAKVHDDLGQYEKAWGFYCRANALKTRERESPTQLSSAGQPPTKPRHAPMASSPPTGSQAGPQGMVPTFADPLIRSFPAEFFRQTDGIGNPDRKPIFVVGMPRSGTTLTEQILTSHPEISGAGELNLINQIRQEISYRQSEGHNRDRIDQTCLAEVLKRTGPIELRRHADRYLEHLESYRGEGNHVTDKMPTNFMHLGLIAVLFPGATVIHCRRHPIDVMVSCFCQNLNAPFCDLDQLVGYHREYRRLMAHWEQVLPIEIFHSDYEALVSDPEPHARAMIRHCGLPWHQDCLKFYQNNRAVHTPSKWQVRQPMYRSSVEKWRRFEIQLAPIAESVLSEIDPIGSPT